MHPELEALLALQEKDQAVTATDAALAALAPELGALDDAQAVAELHVRSWRYAEEKRGLEVKLQALLPVLAG